MKKLVEENNVVVEEVVTEEVLEDMEATVKAAKKAKRKELLTKVKGKTIEVAKYAVPAVLTGIAVKLHYDTKDSKDDDIKFIEGDFEEVPTEEEVVVEEELTGE